MGIRRGVLVGLIGAVLGAATGTALPANAIGPIPAHGTGVRCAEPGATWRSVTPDEASMDAAKLQAAVDDASTDLGLAVRVYRHGCLVQRDRLGDVNQDVQFESWSMAKSATSMVFGRAWSLGLISPDDPLGSLIPEADYQHGALTMRDLLTQTSGLNLNPSRDYNIFMPDRLKAALKTEIDHQPGTTFGYSQSGPALVAEAVQRAVGEDFQAFAQRELFGPIGIEPGTWQWRRDSAGHTQGFFGLQMTPDDYARLGELLRRNGVWAGRRLLSTNYITATRTPNTTNGCHSWLIWINKAKPCNQATGRSEDRMYPGLPADLFSFNGFLDQYVAVMPTQGIVIVRLGGPGPSGLVGGSDVLTGGNGIADLYAGVLGAVRDPVTPPGPPPSMPNAGSPDSAFDAEAIYSALTQPLQTLDPLMVWLLTPLPPAGPARARAAQLSPSDPQATATGQVKISFKCPARWPSGTRNCTGTARLIGSSPPDSAPAVAYNVAPGTTKVVTFTLTADRFHTLCVARTLKSTVSAINQDASTGTESRLALTIRPPTDCTAAA